MKMYEDVLHFEHNRMQINTAYHRIAHSTNQGEAGRSIGASEHRSIGRGALVKSSEIIRYQSSKNPVFFSRRYSRDIPKYQVSSGIASSPTKVGLYLRI
jgi:hypothetical protein